MESNSPEVSIARKKLSIFPLTKAQSFMKLFRSANRKMDEKREILIKIKLKNNTERSKKNIKFIGWGV